MIGEHNDLFRQVFKVLFQFHQTQGVEEWFALVGRQCPFLVKLPGFEQVGRPPRVDADIN